MGRASNAKWEARRRRFFNYVAAGSVLRLYAERYRRLFGGHRKFNGAAR